MSFKAGFISILGRPNVGKSTLMNAMVGEKIAIATSKAQTTRHRIFGIITTDQFQLIYSDTPGIINPAYKLQESMMRYVYASLEDADAVLLVTDFKSVLPNPEIIKKIQDSGTPLIMVLNKIDGKSKEEVEQRKQEILIEVNPYKFIALSAREKMGLDELSVSIVSVLPEHPPYFPEDELTDKTERFLTSEVVREKIFLNYKKEIPYSCEVICHSFKDSPDIIRIEVEIYVERPTQRSIIIGKGGESIKKVGMEARADLEAFFGKKVFLGTHVKVEKDWRKRENILQRFGYDR